MLFILEKPNYRKFKNKLNIDSKYSWNKCTVISSLEKLKMGLFCHSLMQFKSTQLNVWQTFYGSLPGKKWKWSYRALFLIFFHVHAID